MKAEIISVGTELLLGETLDTNSNYLAQELPEIGIDLLWATQIGDNFDFVLDKKVITMDRKNRVIAFIPFKVPKHILLANICMELERKKSNLILGFDFETYPNYDFLVDLL